MKIVFVYPQTPYLTNPDAQIGLGLLSLATLARDLGAEVEVRRLRSAILEPLDCDALLLTGCTVDEPSLVAIATAARESGVPYVAVGGPMTDHEKWGRSTQPFHAVVRGPGEPFVERLIQAGPRCGLFRFPEKQPFDQWPFPDRRLLDGELGGNIYHQRSGGAVQHSTTFLTTRGCPYRCAFCQSGGRRFCHEYPWDRLCGELNAIQRLGVQDVRVTDDSATANLGRLTRLCGELQDRGFRWRASSRAITDPDIWQTMARSGCREVSIGIESADPDILEKLLKGVPVEAGHAAVDAASAAGIHVRALFMMGTPGETDRTLDLNRAWAERHPDVTICLTSFVPFPGTAIWRTPGRFGVRIEVQWGNVNFYAFRPAGTEPEAHVSIVGGMTRDDLTRSLRQFRKWLVERGQHNEG